VTSSDTADREPDIVLVILERVRRTLPGITDDQVRQIEESVRAEYGGLRFRVPKRKKHPTREQRQRVFEQALTDAPDDEITKANGISRRTLYRYLKRGGE
jgi:DNA invertase Pin-like site-specific DNA recombinase